MKLCCYDVSVFKSNNEIFNPDLERINGEAPTVDLNNHVTGVGFTLEFKQSTSRTNTLEIYVMVKPMVGVSYSRRTGLQRLSLLGLSIREDGVRGK